MQDTDKVVKNLSPLAFLGSDIGNCNINEKEISNAALPESVFRALFKASLSEYYIIWSGIACFKYDNAKNSVTIR